MLYVNDCAVFESVLDSVPMTRLAVLGGAYTSEESAMSVGAELTTKGGGEKTWQHSNTRDSMQLRQAHGRTLIDGERDVDEVVERAVVRGTDGHLQPTSGLPGVLEHQLAANNVEQGGIGTADDAVGEGKANVGAHSRQRANHRVGGRGGECVRRGRQRDVGGAHIGCGVE